MKIPTSKTEFIITFEEAPLQEALAAATVNDNPIIHPEHKGIRPFPKNDELNAFLNHHYLYQRRYKLEENTNFRHPIPYGVFYRVVNGTPEFLVYQRTKVTGEGRLAGKHSIGVGGHMELEKVVDYYDQQTQESIPFLKMIPVELMREFTEEFNLEWNGDITGSDNVQEVSPALFINSDVSQDQFHLGLVPVIRMPDSVISFTSKEADQIAVGFFTLDQIKEQFLDNLESWSQLIVNEGDLLSHVNTEDRTEDETANDDHLAEPLPQ